MLSNSLYDSMWEAFSTSKLATFQQTLTYERKAAASLDRWQEDNDKAVEVFVLRAYIMPRKNAVEETKDGRIDNAEKEVLVDTVQLLELGLIQEIGRVWELKMSGAAAERVKLNGEWYSIISADLTNPLDYRYVAVTLKIRKLEKDA